MAEVELKVSGVPETTTQMVLLKWLVELGQDIEQNQPIAEVETDKATIEVMAPIDGFLSMKIFNEGDIITLNDAIGIIEMDRSVTPRIRRRSEDADESNRLHTVMLRLGVICDHCNNAIPVNGFVELVKCYQCHETTQLSGKLRWHQLLNYHNPSIDIFRATKKHKVGEGDYGAWQPVKLKSWRRWPECKSCHNEFGQTDFEMASKNNGLLICNKCSTTAQLKPAPNYIKKVFPEVIYSLDKLPENMDHGGVQIKGSNPIVIACMSCGGSLAIDGTARLVPCKFCNSSNYLPDDLWLALHPQPKMEDWFIVFEMLK